MIRLLVFPMATLYLRITLLLVVIISINVTVSYGQDFGIPKKLRIDPSSAMGGTVSQYISDVEFITFESTKVSAFGNIDQLEITDKFYLILDRETKAILIFTRQGRLHTKIEGQKINPDHPGFYCFLFDKRTQLIKIAYRSNIFYFNLDGKMVRNEKSSMEKYLGVEASLNDSIYAYYSYSPGRPHKAVDSIDYQLKIVENGKIKQQFFPYSLNIKYDNTKGSQPHPDFYPDKASADTSVFFVREYDYNIYNITQHSVNALYQFVFPLSNGLPDNFSHDPQFDGKRLKYLNEHREVIYKIGNFYKSGDYLLFKTISSDFKNLSYIYNIRSQNLICIDRIVSDSSSCFLPLTDAEVGGVEFTSRGLIQFDSTHFYTSYASLALFFMKNATKVKNVRYPPALSKYFNEESNIKGNPVLVRFKIKSDI